MLLHADGSSCPYSLALSLLAGMKASGDEGNWMTFLSLPIRPSRLVHMVAASRFPGSAREREASIEHFGCLCLQWPCSQHIGGCWLTQTQGVRNRFHLLIGAAAVSHTKSRCREGKIYDHFHNLPHCWKQRKRFSSVNYFTDRSILILWVCVGSVAQSRLIFVTLWPVAHQVPLSVELSRQENWCGLPFLQGIYRTQGLNLHLASSALAGKFFATEPPEEPFLVWV